jgi:hypothetical protein
MFWKTEVAVSTKWLHHGKGFRETFKGLFSETS